MINMFQHPDVAKVQWTWASLNPGDCIYIPAGEIISYHFRESHCFSKFISL